MPWKCWLWKQLQKGRVNIPKHSFQMLRMRAASFIVNSSRLHFSSGLLAFILLGIVSGFPADAGAESTSQTGFDCRIGCRKAFRPVCGADGHTYSNLCVATCQGVRIASQGPCPDEHILHPSNRHIVTDDSDGNTAATPADPIPITSATTRPSAASSLVTPRHMTAFSREGYRYAGQVTFAPGSAFLREGPRRSPPPPPSGASPPPPPPPPQRQPRAVRVTREGHVYVADLDKSVDMVLSALIELHSNASTPTTPAHVQTLLHSLRYWRGYSSRDASRHGGMTSWSKNAMKSSMSDEGWGGDHMDIVAGEGFRSGEHTLQPVLDVDNQGFAAAAASAIIAVPRQPGAPANGREEERRAASGPAAGSDAAAASAGSSYERGSGGRGEAKHPELKNLGEEKRWWRRLWQRLVGGAEAVAINGKRQRNGARGGSSSSGGDGDTIEEEKEDGEGEVHRPVRRSLGVFDVDDRVDCPRTPTYPFTAVGQINLKDSTGNYVCSGALVGPDVVLTAAHCVFNRGTQAFYDQVDFAPARYRSLDGVVVNPFGIASWLYMTVVQGYTLPSTFDPNIADIAVIRLKQRIGSQAGWMGVFEPCNPYAPTRYVALTAGYPSDQPSGSCKTTQCVVVQEPCTDGYLYHMCDTVSGQSGSPLYMMAMTSSHKMGPYVRGVHNIEWVQEMPNGQRKAYINSAVSITPDHYRFILAMIGLSFSSQDDFTPMVPALPPANYSTATSPAEVAKIGYQATTGR